MKFIWAATALAGVCSADDTDKHDAPFVPPLITDEDEPNERPEEKNLADSRGVLPKQCYGLVLSDSHFVGPYQAGAIKALVEEMRSTTQAEYQVVSGIALGALNANILGQFPKGSEREAVDKMLDFWTKVGEKYGKLHSGWTLGMIYGFFYENSIWDATGLYDFIAEYFKDSKMKRHVNIGLANVLTGQYKSFKEHHSSEDMVKVLQASVSFPGVFKTVEAFDSVWFAGSSIYETDVIAPINHCRELGYQDKDIVLDVVLSGNPHLHHVYAKIFNAFSVAQRTFELQAYYERMYGIMRAKNGHPDIKFRHVIGPLRDMPSKIVPIDYDPEEVKKQIEVGQKDAEVFIAHYKKQTPVVTSSSGETADKSNYPCFPKRKYHNKERQAKYEQMCGPKFF